MGRPKAQRVGCRTLTAEAWVWFEVSLYGFVVDTVPMVEVLIQVLLFLPVRISPTALHNHSFICHRYYIILATDSTVNTKLQRVNRPCGPKPPHYWDFEITRRNNTLGNIPLDVWLAVTDTSTWPNTTFRTARYPCRRGDLNPQSQQASGRRITPSTARPPS
jgi:hypothetical protein